MGMVRMRTMKIKINQDEHENKVMMMKMMTMTMHGDDNEYLKNELGIGLLDHTHMHGLIFMGLKLKILYV